MKKYIIILLSIFFPLIAFSQFSGVSGVSDFSPWRMSGTSIIPKISSWKVGIGTSTPSYPFSLKGNAYFDSNLITIGSSSPNQMSTSTIINMVQLATTTLSTSTINAFSFANSSSSIPLLSFDTLNQRLGVGTATPGSLLSVQAGNVQVTGTTTSSALVATSTLIVGNNPNVPTLVVLRGSVSGNNLFVGIGTSSPGATLGITSDTAASLNNNIWVHGLHVIGGNNTDLSGTVATFTGGIANNVGARLYAGRWNANDRGAQLTAYSGGSEPTYIHLNAANTSTLSTISFVTASTTQMFLNGSGNLGLGTSSAPFAMFTLYKAGSTAANSPQLVFSASSTVANLNNSLNNWAIGTDSSDGGKFKISSSTVIGTNDRFVIDGRGNVGIGTTTPGSLLSVQAGNAQITGTTTSGSLIATSTLFIGTQSTTNLRVAANGQMFLPNLTQSSSNQTYYNCGVATTFEAVWDTTTCLASALRFKKNIIPINVGLDEILKLQPVNYYLKNPIGINDKIQQFGFIADDVQKIDSRLVTLDNNKKVHGFRYEQFTAVLTKAIQEIENQIQYIFARLSGLEIKVEDQQKQINELKLQIKLLKK